MTQLTGLQVTDAQVSDLSFLRGLTQLKGLSLGYNQIRDLQPLAGLTQLEWLSLWSNEISDLKPLAGLTQLWQLGLSNNRIRDVSPLAGLINLVDLYLRNNPIQDASPLSNLPNLRYADISIPPQISIRNEIPDELLEVGKTLRYRVQIRSAKEVTGFSLTYSTPHTRTSVNSVGWFDGVKHASRNNHRTGTLTASGLEAGQQIRNVAIFTLNATSAGEDELRVRGQLTTVQGRVNVDIRHSITIFGADNAVVTRNTDTSGGTAVSIPDANLAAAVRKALDLGANAPITKQAMQGLTSLDAPDSRISNLTGLEHATQLGFLELRRNQIRNIRPLANLKNLKELILEVNDVRDISPLANLTQLTLLYIGANPISDFTPLANLTELRRLALWDIRMSDLTLLADLTKLTHLYLWNSNISDITPLASLTKLKVLHLEGNQIRNVSPLVNLTQLEELTLAENPIQDMAPLRTLKDRNPELKLDIEISVTAVPGASLNVARPKIEGPWLWMIASTGQQGGRAAAISGKDYLAAASGGAVKEQRIAKNGVKAGALVGNRAWTPGKLAPTGGDNIGETVNAIGLGSGDVDNHVAYGSIALNSPRKQNTTMYVGSDDAVKVWLNGKLVHDNPVDRGASDYQDDFPVTLKKGKNILLVAVYEAGV